MVTGDTVAMGDTAEVMVTEGIDVMAMGDDVMDELWMNLKPQRYTIWYLGIYHDKTPTCCSEHLT